MVTYIFIEISFLVICVLSELTIWRSKRVYCLGFENSQWRTQTGHNDLFFSLLNLDMVPRNSPFNSYRCKRGWSWPCFDTTLPALLCQPQAYVHSKARILSRQLEWIPQNHMKSSWTAYLCLLHDPMLYYIYAKRDRDSPVEERELNRFLAPKYGD